MRPSNPAYRTDYVVERRPFAETAPFIRAHHYARGCANTATESFGLMRAGALVGRRQ